MMVRGAETQGWSSRKRNQKPIRTGMSTSWVPGNTQSFGILPTARP